MKLWIARDKTGSLCMFCKKPKLKDDTIWYLSFGSTMLLKPDLFPEVIFENSPKEVTITLNDD